jgi:uncharacterized protein DUF6624
MRYLIIFLLFSCALWGQQNKDKVEENLNKPLIRQLENIFYHDQHYREMLDEYEKKFGINSKEIKNLWDTINKTDADNLIQVEEIINKYGWLGVDVIGEQGNSTLFLVIQHSDETTRKTCLPIMKEAAKNGKANWSDVALLEDRVAMDAGKKQIYGSQINKDPQTGKCSIAPIEDEINVNKRRQSVGLEPIEEYVKQWGIVYKQGMSNIPSDTTHTKNVSLDNNIKETPKLNSKVIIAVVLLLLLIIAYLLLRTKK